MHLSLMAWNKKMGESAHHPDVITLLQCHAIGSCDAIVNVNQCYFSYGFSVSVVIFQLQLLFFSVSTSSSVSYFA